MTVGPQNVLSLCSAPAHSSPMDLRVHAASGGSDAAMLGDVLDVSEILQSIIV